MLFDPVVARPLYGLDVPSIPEGSAYLPTPLDGLSVTRAFTKCGLCYELSPKVFATCVQGYILEIQRMSEEIDSYLLRPLQTPLLPQMRRYRRAAKLR